MIKLILLVRRKEGTTRQDFRHYYESTHAPLASRLMRHCKRYVRNFIDEEATGPVDFDVITEFWFDVQGPWKEASKHLSDSAAQQALAQDEARFMDRASMRVLIVDEHETNPAQLSGNRS